MREREKQTNPYAPKVDIDRAGRLPESEMSYEEQRKLLEAIIAIELPETYKRHAEFVTKDENGRDTLRLQVPFHDTTAPVTLGREVDDEGNSTSYLTFGGGWENNWKFEDGPKKYARLTPCTRDAETGEFTPKQKEPGDTYDPTTDYEVGFWGNPWIGNLRNGKPERPGTASRARKFGGSVLRRIRK